MVLAQALKTAPGQRVVAIVGKGHVAGIQELWHSDTAALLPAALEEPSAPLGPRAACAAAAILIPYGAWRSRGVRVALGAAALGTGAGAAWFLGALRDRVRFFEHSQGRLQQRASR